MPRQQSIAVGQDHRAFDRILQLADVAGPGVLRQHRQHLGRDRQLLADVA
jgi:hypothetical protein